jgi:hypothetical protein
MLDLLDRDDGLRAAVANLDAEIEPDEIYKRALVEGTLNKQTRDEIRVAVERAQKAYEIAAMSLFRDCSSYSFDSYQKSLASPVSLNDLENFTLKFLAKERRQVHRRNEALEFLTPEPLLKLGLAERYRNGTFDRSRAIRHSELDFFAIGHPFIDTMLRYIGDYEFGGHTAVRFLPVPWISEEALNLQFNFIVRTRVQRGDGTEYLFDLHTVVVGPGGQVDRDLSELAAGSYSMDAYNSAAFEAAAQAMDATTVQRAFTAAKAYLEGQVECWDWDEDVDLAGLAQLVTVPSSKV